MSFNDLSKGRNRPTTSRMYRCGGETLVRPEHLQNFALIIRCTHQRGEDQQNCLAELNRRGLWLSDEQKQRAGIS
jgi:hypothetical protein